MFGYVIVDQKALSDAEQQAYQAAYCGLCHSLGRQYGPFARLTLNYDTAFLALLLASLYEDVEPEHRACRRCLLHPLRRRQCHGGTAADYAAAMTVALAYYNAMDKWQDDRSLPARLLALALAPALRKVEQQWPQQCGAIQQALTALAQYERTGEEASLDAICGCFGRLLACVMDWKGDAWSRPLQALGESLGKFIYLCDAYEDLPRDIRRGRYNPLRAMAEQADYEQRIHDILTLLAAQCTAAFERLPCVQNAAVLRNILYSGIWLRYQCIAAARQKGEKE